ncbi:MAG TPA: glycoside hydrolase family 44 protein [Polyangia bacterium]|nr:glycoside hydrolase family 44 protein [Polyangia bacterium]
MNAKFVSVWFGCLLVMSCGASPGGGSGSGGNTGAAGQGSGGSVGRGGTGGGFSATGGTIGTGGTKGSGGSIGTGGVSSTGGQPGSGGATSVGGHGGSSAAGGTGGAIGTGGAAGSGGTTAGAGGTAGLGGSSGTGGSACTPSCASKTCGSDGCNGTCGGCPPTQMCGANGTCQTPTGSGVFVDATAQLTSISPDIYGVAFATDSTDDSSKVATLDRWGGDAEESYNWQKDMNNSGGDWNCANYAGSGSGTDTFVQTNKSNGLDTLMTIPITGWLANVATSSDSTYSSVLGQDLSFCNYPQLPDGGLLSSATCCKAIGTQESLLVDQGSNNLDTSFMQSWVNHFVSTFGTAARGGIKYYQLDNEPDNWQGLRQDIYPALYAPGTNCLDYSVKISSGKEAGVSPNDDIMNRSIAYATAIKSADPTAQVLFLSVMNPDDMINLMQTECGVGTWGNAAVPYTIGNSYAMAMMAKGKQYEAAHNHQRIFDCLDSHYPGTAQQMWTNTFSHFQGWINSSYPGTGVCVSEYNVANDTSDQTAAAQEADYLGTFGLMGVRVAAYWTTLAPKNSSNAHVHSYAYNAFAMFRNYDGAGSAFGDVSVGAASSYSGVHAYAATDSASNPTTLWVMLVNTGGSTQSGMSLTLKHFSAGASAKVYQSVNGAAPTAGANAAVSNGVISGLSVAANSVTLLVVGH